MEKNEREVRFDIYCPLCKYAENAENYEPCCNCLEVFWRDGTAKPEQYVAKNPDPIMTNKH